jgi:hypothetical protein
MSMIATQIRTIREEVILLLRKSGHSVIEAIEKWDRVYSVQYAQAQPGITHTWHIGDYEFEFTKQATKINALQAITQAHEEEYGLRRAKTLRRIAIVIILIVVIVITSTLFEDGSFKLLGIIKGCLPWSICNL